MKKNPFDYPIFIDCGAPSLYNKLSRKSGSSKVMGVSFKDRKFDSYTYTNSEEYIKYRNEYIRFIQKNKDKIDYFSNLDVINNPKLTLKNQRYLEEKGITPIPVWHLGSDERYLKKYIDNYKYIAFGGLVPNKVSVLVPMLDRIFKKYLLDDKGFPIRKIHGFAATSMPLVKRYPWYSVDSTVSVKTALYGRIVFPQKKGSKLNIVPISTRDIPIEYQVSPLLLKDIIKVAGQYGITLEELMNDYIIRAKWNYLMFTTVLEREIPKYPWSFTTRKEKENADDFLTFYFAGSLKGEKEEFMWKWLHEKGITLPNGRLHSFFYSKEAQTSIDLRHENK